MHKLRGLVVDPEELTITEVMITQDNIHDIYAQIGVDTFDTTVVDLTDSDDRKHQLTCFVDDEGLLRDDRAYFTFLDATSHQPLKVRLAGKCLVMGATAQDGSMTGCTISRSVLAHYVVFYVQPDEEAAPCYVLARHCDMARMMGAELPPVWRDSTDIEWRSDHP